MIDERQFAQSEIAEEFSFSLNGNANFRFGGNNDETVLFLMVRKWVINILITVCQQNQFP